MTIDGISGSSQFTEMRREDVLHNFISVYEEIKKELDEIISKIKNP